MGVFKRLNLQRREMQQRIIKESFTVTIA